MTAASLWTWLAIGLCATAGFLVQLVLLPTVIVDRQRRLIGRIFRLGAVTATRMAPMWRFAVHGQVPARSPGRCVVVSNHVSHLDAFLISRLPWEMKWLAKKSLLRVPAMGWSMWLSGDIAVGRSDAASIRAAMQRCRHYLRRRMPVCIFPEGTRAQEDALLPFKDGAFRLAIEAGADILPLAVAGTRAALPKHAWRFGPSRGLVVAGRFISTEGLTLADVGGLREQVRARIEEMLAEIRPLCRLVPNDTN